jgi:hypothetical protein
MRQKHNPVAFWEAIKMLSSIGNFGIALFLGASYGVVFYVAGVILIDRAWSTVSAETGK